MQQVLLLNLLLQTAANHKAPETEHGLAMRKIFSGQHVHGPPPLHYRVCVGGSYAPSMTYKNL